MSDTDLVPYNAYQIAKEGVIERMAKTLAVNLGGGAISEADFIRARMPTGDGTQFKISTMGGEKLLDEIEGIIVAFGPRNAYWPGEFKGGGTPPTCSSKDGLIGLGEFRRGSKDNPSGACATCPKGQFGSLKPLDPDDNRMACKQMNAVFILPPDALLPIMIALPPTSLKRFREFRVQISGAGLPIYGVRVAASLVTAVSKSGGISYSEVAWRGDPISVEESDDMENYSEKFRTLIGDMTFDLELEEDLVDATPQGAIS